MRFLEVPLKTRVWLRRENVFVVPEARQRTKGSDRDIGELYPFRLVVLHQTDMGFANRDRPHPLPGENFALSHSGGGCKDQERPSVPSPAFPRTPRSFLRSHRAPESDLVRALPFLSDDAHRILVVFLVANRMVEDAAENGKALVDKDLPP
jgi:hypothetical protein